jgi:hypothetical protein
LTIFREAELRKYINRETTAAAKYASVKKLQTAQENPDKLRVPGNRTIAQDRGLIP